MVPISPKSGHLWSLIETFFSGDQTCHHCNGDVFILDSGASCVHVADKSTVAKDFILGAYLKPAKDVCSSDAVIKAANVTFSNNLTDITKDGNAILVVMWKKVIISFKNCCLAEGALKCKVLCITKNILPPCVA